MPARIFSPSSHDAAVALSDLRPRIGRCCIAHLAEGDARARGGGETRRPLWPLSSSPRRPPRRGALNGRQVDARARSVAERVDWWRTERDRVRRALRTRAARDLLPWAGRRMRARSFATSRLVACWSHGLEALEAAGPPPIVTDHIRHLAPLGSITRAGADRNRERPPPVEPLRVELDAPSGARWTWGPADPPTRIAGSPVDCCRVVPQRGQPSDTDRGTAAAECLPVAPAFAGPPGSGRPPSSCERGGQNRASPALARSAHLFYTGVGGRRTRRPPMPSAAAADRITGRRRLAGGLIPHVHALFVCSRAATSERMHSAVRHAAVHARSP